jgi:hypothetical protein
MSNQHDDPMHTRLAGTFAHPAVPFVAAVLSRLPELLRDTPRPARWGRLAVAVALVITHVVWAPIALWRTTSLSEYRWAKLRLPETQDLAGKAIVVVNGPANADGRPLTGPPASDAPSWTPLSRPNCGG